MAAGFTVDLANTAGMRGGRWAPGQEFLIRERRGEERTVARVVLRPQPGHESDGPASRPVTVAEVEERARSGGIREPHPVLELSDRDGAPLATVRPEEAVPWPRRFEVTDGRHRPLGRITRRRPGFGHRGSWVIDAPGREPVTGREGTAAGWAVFVLVLPLWTALFALSLLVALATLGTVTQLLTWGPPRSVVWRRRRAAPFAGRALTFGHVRTAYRRAGDEALDPRLAHAQAALHYLTRMYED
ncbi:hypothetical protein [Streptomyces sp. SBT349]|uniref:hypothetical protein n=1 Tax=Streptomyces sp. SBT349 TaxID=1580539 RepID=UPI00066CD266|nr:hypothetical protein [Streptomyces sp. SBT349]